MSVGYELMDLSAFAAHEAASLAQHHAIHKETVATAYSFYYEHGTDATKVFVRIEDEHSHPDDINDLLTEAEAVAAGMVFPTAE